MLMSCFFIMVVSINIWKNWLSECLLRVGKMILVVGCLLVWYVLFVFCNVVCMILIKFLVVIVFNLLLFYLFDFMVKFGFFYCLIIRLFMILLCWFFWCCWVCECRLCVFMIVKGKVFFLSLLRFLVSNWLY